MYALLIVLLAHTAAYAQEFWVFPKQNQPPAAPNPAPLRDACLNPSQWPTGWDRMTWFGNSIQYWEAWRQSAPAEVSQCFTNLRNANKTVVIELGALKPHCQTGQACFDQSLPTLAALVGLGMPTDKLYLAIDEPLTTGHPNFAFGNGGPYADFGTAVAETVNFIAAARVYGPIKFILHEAYPTPLHKHSICVLVGFQEEGTPGSQNHGTLRCGPASDRA
jgi:hypothetical protein